MFMKALCVFAGLVSVSAAEAYVTSPRHVVALHQSDQTAEVKVAPPPLEPSFGLGDASEQIVMPPLDVRAKLPHKQNVRAAKRFVCEEARPMVGVPGGKARVEYGHVARCEWL